MLPHNLIKDLAKLCNLSYLNNIKIQETFTNKPYSNICNVFNNCSQPRFITSNEDCQLYTCKYNNYLIVWFRGTESIKDILIDLKFTRVPLNLNNLDTNVLVHNGFYTQFESIFNELNSTIFEYINDNSNRDKHIIFTGHSLGGALATIGSCYYCYRIPFLNISCVTFGSPRVGNKDFTDAFNNKITNSYRYVNDDDPVPCLPSRLRYKHVNGCRWIYNDQILNETKGWRFWRFIKSSFLNLFGYGYNPLDDHNCKNYLEDLEKCKY